MNFVYQTIFTLTCLTFSSLVVAASCQSECQLEQIETYFAALDKISQKNSTVEDIDSLLGLMHDDVNYIHVEYQANFNKATWRKAFIRNLKRGAYQNSTKNEKRILNSIFGKNHVAIEYSHGVIQDNGNWQQTEPLLAIFGFTDGKISLVKELW